jgi:hypothetical protein
LTTASIHAAKASQDAATVFWSTLHRSSNRRRSSASTQARKLLESAE